MCISLRFFIPKTYCYKVLTREEQRINKFCIRTTNGEHINWVYFRIRKSKYFSSSLRFVRLSKHTIHSRLDVEFRIKNKRTNKNRFIWKFFFIEKIKFKKILFLNVRQKRVPEVLSVCHTPPVHHPGTLRSQFCTGEFLIISVRQFAAAITVSGP